MRKEIDLKKREVKMYDVDTGVYEDEIVGYLNRKMKVRFFGAFFNNSNYVFIGDPADHISNCITVSSYRKKTPGENTSILIG